MAQTFPAPIPQPFVQQGLPPNLGGVPDAPAAPSPNLPPPQATNGLGQAYRGEPKTPEELQARTSGWSTFIEKLASNPDMSNALIRMGATLMQPRESDAGQLGKAAVVGLESLKADAASRRAEKREDAGDARAEKALELQGKQVGLQGEQVDLQGKQFEYGKERDLIKDKYTDRELGIRERLAMAQERYYGLKAQATQQGTPLTGSAYIFNQVVAALYSSGMPEEQAILEAQKLTSAGGAGGKEAFVTSFGRAYGQGIAQALTPEMRKDAAEGMPEVMKMAGTLYDEMFPAQQQPGGPAPIIDPNAAAAFENAQGLFKQTAFAKANPDATVVPAPNQPGIYNIILDGKVYNSFKP